MEILVLCGIYLVELLCYRMGLRVLFDTKVKWSRWLIAGVMVPVFIGILPIYVLGKLVLNTVFVIVLNLIMLKGKLMEKIFENLMVLVLTSCLDDIIETIEEKIFDIENKFNIGINEKYLLMQSFALIILIIIYIVSKQIHIQKKVHVSSFAYFIIGLAAVSMMSGLAFLKYIMSYFGNSSLSEIFAVLDVVVYVNVILLVVFIVNIKKTNTKIEELLKTEKMLKDMQMNYYHRLLTKEEETRKYRHDMNNHFYYIQTLLENERVEEAKRYFKKLQGNFKNIQNRQYVTGNEMVDVIMNYFFSLLPGETKVQIIGKCSVKLAVEDVDVCTIFSNVFQNIVDAIEKHGKKDGEVEISIKKGRAYVEYVVGNTFTGKIFERLDKGGYMPVSGKVDEGNHGVGLTNVKVAVERNYGNFSWEVKEGWFYVKIILPI